jgi:hypothetical protein
VPSAEQAALRGMPIEEAFGPSCKTIPFAQLHEAYKDRTEAKLYLFHSEDGKPPPYRTEVFVADAAVRDEVFDELHRRLGPGWRIEDRSVGAWWTALLAVIVVGIASFAAFMGTWQAEAGMAPDPVTGKGVVGQGIMETLAGSIGSLGVLGVGVVLTGLCVWWMLHMKKHPPESPVIAILRAEQKGMRY